MRVGRLPCRLAILRGLGGGGGGGGGSGGGGSRLNGRRSCHGHCAVDLVLLFLVDRGFAEADVDGIRLDSVDQGELGGRIGPGQLVGPRLVLCN